MPSEEMKHRCPKCRRFGMSKRFYFKYGSGLQCMWRNCGEFVKDEEEIEEMKE